MPEPSLERLLQVIANSGAEFVVVGGLALILNGGDSVTYDLDITPLRSRESARRLATALAPYHPLPVDWPDGLPYIWDEESILRSTVLTLQTDLGRLDLLAEPDGAPRFAELKTRSSTFDLDGIAISVACIDDLISMKRAAGRPKDLGHIAELESIKRILDPEEPRP